LAEIVVRDAVARQDAEVQRVGSRGKRDRPRRVGACGNPPDQRNRAGLAGGLRGGEKRSLVEKWRDRREQPAGFQRLGKARGTEHSIATRVATSEHALSISDSKDMTRAAPFSERSLNEVSERNRAGWTAWTDIFGEFLRSASFGRRWNGRCFADARRARLRYGR